MSHTNLAFRQNSFRIHRCAATNPNRMTVLGTAYKTLALGLLCALGGGYTLHYFQNTGHMAASFQSIGVVSMIAAFLLSIATMWNVRWSPVTAPLYALCKGATLACVVLVVETRYPGIPRLAALLTATTFLAMLCLYSTNLIQVNNQFSTLLMGLGLSLIIASGIHWILIAVGYTTDWLTINTINIGFSLAYIVYFAFSLLSDFAYIQQGERRGAPLYMEWYSGFALLITIIGMYIRFLRLLMALDDRRRRR